MTVGGEQHYGDRAYGEQGYGDTGYGESGGSSPRGGVTIEEETFVVGMAPDRGPRRDRVRWGPVWGGLVTAVATYLLLQLVLVAVDLVDVDSFETSDALWSAGVAIVAFFLGGLVVGGSTMWRRADDGLLNGVILWALGIVAIIVLSTAGGGVALGSFDTSDTFDDLSADDIDAQTQDDAQDAAGYAVTGIVVALVASAAGAVAGTYLWPRADDRDRAGRDRDIDLREPNRSRESAGRR